MNETFMEQLKSGKCAHNDAFKCLECCQPWEIFKCQSCNKNYVIGHYCNETSKKEVKPFMEFKVDKLGFYRTVDNEIAIITSFNNEDGLAVGNIKNSQKIGYCWFIENGKTLFSHLCEKNLIEFIAPFDVWEYAKGLEK